MQPPLRVEDVRQRQEVALVGAAAMRQHEQADRLAQSRSLRNCQ
jgi:hypothetical protein